MASDVESAIKACALVAASRMISTSLVIATDAVSAASLTRSVSRPKPDASCAVRVAAIPMAASKRFRPWSLSSSRRTASPVSWRAARSIASRCAVNVDSRAPDSSFNRTRRSCMATRWRSCRASTNSARATLASAMPSINFDWRSSSTAACGAAAARSLASVKLALCVSKSCPTAQSSPAVASIIAFSCAPRPARVSVARERACSSASVMFWVAPRNSPLVVSMATRTWPARPLRRSPARVAAWPTSSTSWRVVARNSLSTVSRLAFKIA